jgi:hypothetical protein
MISGDYIITSGVVCQGKNERFFPGLASQQARKIRLEKEEKGEFALDKPQDPCYTNACLIG